MPILAEVGIHVVRAVLFVADSRLFHNAGGNSAGLGLLCPRPESRLLRMYCLRARSLGLSSLN